MRFAFALLELLTTPDSGRMSLTAGLRRAARRSSMRGSFRLDTCFTCSSRSSHEDANIFSGKVDSEASPGAANC
jgi:hypothetical protein